MKNYNESQEKGLSPVMFLVVMFAFWLFLMMIVFVVKDICYHIRLDRTVPHHQTMSADELSVSGLSAKEQLIYKQLSTVLENGRRWW